MKKQKLFNLSSMPKMVLIITLVVMLGSLFGAMSYLLKMPTTDLPIVNPVVETQCKIDSDCELVYVGQDICPPCDTLSEEYQCLNENEKIKIWEERDKSKPPVVCSPCPFEFDRYTCKCANGKCEKIKEEEVEEVVITTDKMEYEIGEEVNITIENNLDKDIRVYMPLSGIERFDNNNWMSIKMVLGICGVTGGLVYDTVESYGVMEYNWYQEEKWCNEPMSVVSEPISRQVSGGIYRIKSIKMDLDNFDSKQTIYSNEFTIKEKSAVDARCEEKVKGIGFCELYKEGYEFNSETGKCIKRGVSGCSFEIPFETLEECQEVCEKAEPKDKEFCEKLGGTWVIGDVEVCSLPTSDSGKECSDSSQCEGYCIAELSEEEYKKTMQGTAIYTKGKCTARTTAFGCAPHVDDGKVFGILCMD